MSWGYWGILAGLGALLGVFFLSMELLYVNARNAGKKRTVLSSEVEAGEGAKDVRHRAA